MHRTNLQIVLFLLLIFGFSKAQNLPEIGTISSNNINTKTTNNYLIVGNISDGDLASSQTLTVQAISSNNAILSILGTDFYTTSGQNFAKINLKQFDVNGIVTLSVTLQIWMAAQQKVLISMLVSITKKGADGVFMIFLLGQVVSLMNLKFLI